jgi:hypothetical protein
VFVNDTAADARRRVTVSGRTVDIDVKAGASRLVLWERSTGRTIVQSPERTSGATTGKSSTRVP